MSLKCMVWAWDLSFKVASHKLVLLALADNANDEGSCWPALSTISKKCGIDQKPLRRILKKLQEYGYISDIKPRYQDNGKQTSNEYILNTGYIDPILPCKYPSPSPTGTPPPLLQVPPKTKKSDVFKNENKELQDSKKSELYILTKNITNIYLPGFENFIAAHPIKAKRFPALKIWVLLNLEAKADLIVSDVKKRNELEWSHRERHMIPHPDKYLINLTWEDEIIERSEKPIKPITQKPETGMQRALRLAGRPTC